MKFFNSFFNLAGNFVKDNNIQHKISLIFVAITSVLFFFVVCQLNPSLPSDISLDSSWITSIGEAIGRLMVFGKEVVFTFGLGLMFANATCRWSYIASPLAM